MNVFIIIFFRDDGNLETEYFSNGVALQGELGNTT